MIQESDNDLKPGRHAAINRAEVSSVDRSHIARVVLEHHVRDLKQLDRLRHHLTIGQSFQSSRKQRGSADLKLESLGVGKHNGGLPVVRSIKLLKRLRMRAETEGQDLCEASLCDLASQKIGELIHRLLLSDSIRRGDSSRHVVVAVGDGDIFCDVTGLEHIVTGRGDDAVEGVVALVQLSLDLHATKKLDLLLCRQIHANDPIDVVHSCSHYMGLQVWIPLLIAIRIDHFHILTSERLLAVAGEHRDHRVQDNLGAHRVCCCAFDENVLSLHTDLGVISVDDRGEG
mmetsp:Transcript_33061/g.74210  ORF Transcript_33061/g.74210 Transcript_33061/m.74210 type:complete len:287 (+) Transcript_33061:329-1189(+)